MEQWKDIKDYEGLYRVSNLGKIKSLRFGKELLMKPVINIHGYYTVKLRKNGKSIAFVIHRLVYQAFIGELIKGLVIDHISGVKTENEVENLQQITNRENVVKGERTKNRSSQYVGVGWNKSRNKWISYIVINGKQKYLGCFDNEEEAAQAYQNALKSLNQIN